MSKIPELFGSMVFDDKVMLEAVKRHIPPGTEEINKAAEILNEIGRDLSRRMK